MEMSCVIIDDEPHALAELAELIGRTPGIFLVSEFCDVRNALQFFGEGETVDIIFSDIDMPMIDGITAASLLQGYCRELVFVTAHREYALEAFGVRAAGYLLKPVGFIPFVELVSGLSQKRGLGQTDNGGSIAFIKGDRKHSFLKLALREVVFIEAMLNYVKIVTIEGVKVTYAGLKDVEDMLRPKAYFLRISKSLIVNMDFVDRVDGNLVYLNDGTSMTIGQSYREAFRDFLRKRTFNP